MIKTAFIKTHIVNGNVYHSLTESYRVPGVKTPRHRYIQYLGKAGSYSKSTPFYKPMKLTDWEGPVPKKGGDWLAEPKFDGVRTIALIDKKGRAFINRRETNQTLRYPEFDKFSKQLKFKDAVILDGEVVAFKGKKDDFKTLSTRDRLKDKKIIFQKSTTTPLTYVAFDILDKDGKSLINLPIEERKKILDNVIPDDLKRIKEIKFTDDPIKLIKESKKLGREGIVLKKKKSFYYPGKSTPAVWRKLKFKRDADVAIVGYTNGSGKREGLFGALIMAVWDKKLNEYKYIGKVGTGFTDEKLKELKKVMDKNKTSKSVIDTKIKEVQWLKPKLVAKIEFLKMGSQGSLREPSFIDLRTDKTTKQTHSSRIKVWKKGKIVSTRKPKEVLQIANLLKKQLKPFSKKIHIGGSIARKRLDPTDIDILVIPKNKDKYIDTIKQLGKIIALGNRRVEANIKGVKVDTFFVNETEYPTAEVFIDGPYGGNIGLRIKSKKKNFILNQYGLFKRTKDNKPGKRIPIKSDRDLYNKLEIPYKPPELRGQ